MPFTPDANLIIVRFFGRSNTMATLDVLDKLLGLDIAHAMNTGNTISVQIG